MVIVDTSVLYDALVPGPGTVQARALFGAASDICAPDIILVEIAGALTKGVRRGVIELSFARKTLQVAPSLLQAIDPVGALLGRGFELSLELAHPLGDCLFLALAETKSAQLVTADRRFARKVAASALARYVLELAQWQT